MDTTSPLPPLGVVELWRASVAFERRLAAELAPLGLTIPAFRLIGEVMQSPDGVRQGELARRLGVRPPTVSAAVARLEGGGLVHRVVDPDDPRARRVCLTPGAPLGGGVDVLQTLEDAVFEGLSAVDRRQILRALTILNERLAPESDR